jgi:hypothetical protein
MLGAQRVAVTDALRRHGGRDALLGVGGPPLPWEAPRASPPDEAAAVAAEAAAEEARLAELYRARSVAARSESPYSSRASSRTGSYAGSAAGSSRASSVRSAYSSDDE